MSLKKVNEFFGISLLTIGILKILLMILVLIQSGNAAVSMVTGGEAKLFDASFLGDFVGILQIVVAACSFIMIFVNIKKYPEVIMGYVIGILALILEIILPAIIFFIYGFVEGILYINASNVVRNKKFKLFSIETDSSEKVENTDWFYGDKDK